MPGSAFDVTDGVVLGWHVQVSTWRTGDHFLPELQRLSRETACDEMKTVHLLEGSRRAKLYFCPWKQQGRYLELSLGQCVGLCSSFYDVKGIHRDSGEASSESHVREQSVLHAQGRLSLLRESATL